MVMHFNVILVMQRYSLMHTHCPLLPPTFPLQHPCSLVWSGEGSALFVCLQSQIHCITVQEGIPPLAQLSREAICKAITSEDHISTLPLPRHEQANLLHSGVPAVHVPLPVSTLSSWEPLFFPVQPNVRIHCSINSSPVDTSEECQFTLNLEHCGDVIPLMKGVLTTSKLLPFSSHCHIKPASGLMFCAKSELWAAPPLPRPPHAITPSLPRRVMKRLRRVIRSGQLHDAGSPMGGSPVASPSHHVAITSDHFGNFCPPVLAKVDINTFTYGAQFTGNLAPWNVSLGSIAIAANYFKNEPRRVTVVLPPSPGYHEGFTLKSRRPHWNPEHAVYELDFGGRINRDSVKNFQLEHNGEVVSDTGAPSV